MSASALTPDDIRPLKLSKLDGSPNPATRRRRFELKPDFPSQLALIAARNGPVDYVPAWVSDTKNASGRKHSLTYMERLCHGVRSVFCVLLEMPTLHRREPPEIINSVRRSYETVVIWDDDFNVSLGGLNETFQRSPEIRNLTAKVLNEVAEILTKGLAPLLFGFELGKLKALQDLVPEGRFLESHGYDSDEEDGNSGGARETPKDLVEIIKSLSAATECLSSMAPLYEEPPVEFIPYETERQADDGTAKFRPEQAFLDQILERLPNINHDLATTLAQANVWRVVHCREQQDDEKKDGDSDSISKNPLSD